MSHGRWLLSAAHAVLGVARPSLLSLPPVSAGLFAGLTAALFVAASSFIAAAPVAAAVPVAVAAPVAVVVPTVDAAAVAVAAPLAVAAPPSAVAPASSAAPKVKRPTLRLQLYRDGLVHGTLLEQGPYRVEIAPTLLEATFYRGKKAVVTAPCHVTARTEAVNGDSVFYAPRSGGKDDIVRIALVRPELVIDFVEEVESSPVADLEPDKK